MRIKKNIIISLTFLFWLALPLAVAAEDAAPVPAAVTPAPGTAENAAEKINVQLKVPLPFVPTRCTAQDPNDETKTVPAVCNLKDYLEGIYRLLIGVGALFAVVMIIIAGYQYLTSGGSADKTGAAKKRIWNACIGLVLALMSYIILNAISARLVEMELPKIEPIRPIFDDANLACQNHEKVVGPLADIAAGGSNYNVSKAQALCGNKYVDSKSGTQCWGDKCSDPETACVKDKCREVLLYGSISWSGFGSNSYVDNIKILPICNNMEPSIISAMFGMGRLNMLAYESVARQTAYRFQKISFKPLFSQAGSGLVSQDPATVPRETIKKRLDAQCADRDGVKGFALEIEVNDDSHFFGLTIDDGFVLGRDCSRPFYSQDAHGKRLYNGKDIVWKDVLANQLFQSSDFAGTNGAAQCNITIDRSVFPAR